ncbi:hypothetical protein NKDENANG_02982 [Candidatus Entotheonellaceae bacterium PAL068K]
MWDWQRVRTLTRVPSNCLKPLNLCEPAGRTHSLHLTDIGLSDAFRFHSGNAVVGTTQAVINDARCCQELGMQQLTYDFHTDDYQAQIAIMERLADRVIPAVAS